MKKLPRIRFKLDLYLVDRLLPHSAAWWQGRITGRKIVRDL